ncbi:uncharacterized protein LOC131649523 [Vicia villosa]|uniref:uncharacterized protein LOC131649523 n=1 Tax=Vicia villosa TaxID=3911 RepID=UPI00273AC6BA|nr:uncharacterized protein LOC131649523 [Vicia villosa]
MVRGGWTKVSHNKRFAPRWNTFPYGGRNLKFAEKKGEITSLFVSDFPDDTTAKVLFELFGCSGNVVEVAIAPRRNAFGKRFGFARFVEVTDGRLLAVRLDNIIIAGKKIHVNVPRFDRRQVGGVRNFGNSVRGNQGNFGVRHSVGNKVAPRTFLARKDCSYVEVVSKDLEGRGSMETENDVVQFKSSDVLRGRLEKAYVAKVCIPGSAHTIQTHFEMEGVFAVKVSPLGSSMCLLEELEDGFIEDLIGGGEDWWKGWFSEIKKWEVGAVAQERDVWIRIYGIPVHA